VYLLDNHQSLDLAKETAAVLLFSPRHGTHRLSPFCLVTKISWSWKFVTICDNPRLHSEAVPACEVWGFGRTGLLRRSRSLLLWLPVHLKKMENLKILDSEILLLQLEIRYQASGLHTCHSSSERESQAENKGGCCFGWCRGTRQDRVFSDIQEKTWKAKQLKRTLEMLSSPERKKLYWMSEMCAPAEWLQWVTCKGWAQEFTDLWVCNACSFGNDTDDFTSAVTANAEDNAVYP
jgi:hypothetical protein